MARITVEDCIDKFESRFELVLVASNRARKLHTGENPTVERDNDKNTVIALREIADETLPIADLKDNLVLEYQTVAPISEEEELSHEDSPEKDEINIDDNSDDNNKATLVNEINEVSDLVDEPKIDNDENINIEDNKS